MTDAHSPDIAFEDQDTREDITVSKGTFCGVIGHQLLVSSCPLNDGRCMWKHRKTGMCAYTNLSLNAHEFAEHVGLPPLDAAAVNIIRSSLKLKVYREMAR
jgi:hypothetical protein